MRAYFRPGVDPQNFGGGMQFSIRLNVYYCKYKNGRRLDAEKGVNKLFKNVSFLRRDQKLFKEATPNFDIFLSVYFFGRINLKLVEKQKKALEGPGICFSAKSLKIHVLQPLILVHFEQLTGKLYSNFCP